MTLPEQQLNDIFFPSVDKIKRATISREELDSYLDDLEGFADDILESHDEK